MSDAFDPTLDAGTPGAAAAGTLAVGARLGGRYHIRRFLGRGGMGAVYLALDEALDHEVALKLLKVGDAGLARLRDEVKLAQRVTHTNVCRTYDLEDVDGQWLVKMEYVAGETVTQRVARAPLAIDEALAIARALAAGLAAAHDRGVVHRDLKPDNVLLEADTGRAVIMDFGIARRAELAGQTGEGVAGTPAFMAPEQSLGREVDGRADLYALGCVLWCALTGAPPYRADTPVAMGLQHLQAPIPDLRKARPDAPTWLAAAVQRLLAKDPADRPATGRAAIDLLAGPPPKRTRRALIAGIAVVVIAGTAGAALLVTRAEPRPAWRPEIRELTERDEYGTAPGISPDGTQLAFSSDREQPGRSRIYVAPLDGDGPERPVSPPELSLQGVHWAQDGRTLYAVAMPGWDAYEVPLDGGEPRLIGSGVREVAACGAVPIFVSIADDACRACTTLIVHEPSGDRVLLSSPGVIATPRCSQDGTQVVFGQVRADRPSTRPLGELWVMTLGEAPRRVLDELLLSPSASFTPDGRAVVFPSDRGGRQNLWELSLATGRTRQLTFGDGPDVSPDVSVDGRLVVYEIDPGTTAVFTYPPDGGGKRRITSLIETVMQLSASARDGSLAASVQRDKRRVVVRIDVATGDEQVIADGIISRFTVDGTELIYVTEAFDVMAMPAAGGAPRTIGRLPAPPVMMVPGPDRHLYFDLAGEHGYQPWRLAEAGGVAEPIVGPNRFPGPAGGWFAETTSSGATTRYDLYVADEATPRHTITQVRRFAFAPDGETAVTYAQGVLRRLDLATGATTELGRPDWIIGLAVGPDGTVYTTEKVSRVRRELITNFATRPPL